MLENNRSRAKTWSGSGGDLGDGAFVERDPVKVSAVPPCKGPLGIGTVATHISKGGVPMEHEQKP